MVRNWRPIILLNVLYNFKVWEGLIYHHVQGLFSMYILPLCATMLVTSLTLLFSLAIVFKTPIYSLLIQTCRCCIQKYCYELQCSHAEMVFKIINSQWWLWLIRLSVIIHGRLILTCIRIIFFGFGYKLVVLLLSFLNGFDYWLFFYYLYLYILQNIFVLSIFLPYLDPDF